jgi:hypothetical protein
MTRYRGRSHLRRISIRRSLCGIKVVHERTVFGNSVEFGHNLCKRCIAAKRRGYSVKQIRMVTVC